MGNQMIPESFLVDPAAPLHAPQPKVMAGGMPTGIPAQDRIAQQLDETALKALRLIDKAISGRIDTQEGRVQLGLASVVLSTWGRYQQTQTARWGLQMRTQELAARDVTPRVSD